MFVSAGAMAHLGYDQVLRDHAIVETYDYFSFHVLGLLMPMCLLISFWAVWLARSVLSGRCRAPGPWERLLMFDLYRSIAVFGLLESALLPVGIVMEPGSFAFVTPLALCGSMTMFLAMRSGRITGGHTAGNEMSQAVSEGRI